MSLIYETYHTRQASVKEKVYTLVATHTSTPAVFSLLWSQWLGSAGKCSSQGGQIVKVIFSFNHQLGTICGAFSINPINLSISKYWPEKALVLSDFVSHCWWFNKSVLHIQHYQQIANLREILQQTKFLHFLLCITINISCTTAHATKIICANIIPL